MNVKRALLGILIIWVILLCFYGFKYGGTNPDITTNNGYTTYEYGEFSILDEKIGQDLQKLTGITVEKVESHEINFSIITPVVLYLITKPLVSLDMILVAVFFYVIIDIIIIQRLLSKISSK
jgi:hypothetical protein